MRDPLIEYGPVYTCVDVDDSRVYAMSVTLDWARKRGFEARRNADWLSVLWLEPSTIHTPLAGLHGIAGTLHVAPGSESILLSAYTYPKGAPREEHHRGFLVGEDLDTEMTKFFEKVAWPVRH